MREGKNMSHFVKRAVAFGKEEKRRRKDGLAMAIFAPNTSLDAWAIGRVHLFAKRCSHWGGLDNVALCEGGNLRVVFAHFG